MKTLRERLRQYEQKLRELSNPANAEEMTSEVRAILIETCRSAIAQLKEEIEETT
ncbi:MAG: hypothetical protein ABW006_14300 [Hyphomicrobium sp.]